MYAKFKLSRWSSHPLIAAIGLLAASTAMPAQAGQYFTQNQASAGKHVYSNHCSQCHGGDLGGGAGPALTGKDFSGSLNYSGMSAKQLYSFISQHMPKTDPGSLSTQQYNEVYSYLLCVNGFKPGKKKLDKSTTDKISLLPLPSKTKQSCG